VRLLKRSINSASGSGRRFLIFSHVFDGPDFFETMPYRPSLQTSSAYNASWGRAKVVTISRLKLGVAMRRRPLIKLLGGAVVAAWPFVACAQQTLPERQIRML
jgi:hypothetical protein